MERVVVIGASIGGLATALALKHSDRQVLIVERDDPPPEIDPGSAFDRWERRGVPHFRLAHSLLARLPTMLRQHHPELLQELAVAGVEPCPIEFALPSNQVASHQPHPSDIDLRHLLSRRATFEYVLRRHVERLPHVRFVHGARVEGLATSAHSRQLQVSGLRIVRGSAREHVDADLVVDASGNRSRSADWLRALGAKIHVETQTSEFSYFCRHYRMRDGGAAPFRRTGAILDYLWFGAFFAEHGHFSLALACPSAEVELVETMRRADGFDAIARSLPGVDALIDRSDVTSKVLGAGGFSNRWTHYMVKGEAAALGFFAVGDSHVHTNPMYGRGCAAAFVQAHACADVVVECSDPVARARRYHQRVWTLLRPQFDFCRSAEQLYAARGRRARGEPIQRVMRVADYFTDQVWTPSVLESPFIARESVKVMQMQAMSGFWTRLATMLWILLLWARRGFRHVGPAPERTGPERSALLNELAEMEAEHSTMDAHEPAARASAATP
jgi:2-polyprenyl-6-methoxyphenol hydroxylase-like FAD-dependent oxidoreductase